MTTAAGRPLSRFAYTARTMSHYSMWFAAWLCASNVLMAVVPQSVMWAQWTLVWTGYIFGLLPLVMSYYGDQVHVRAWDCPTCVARTPILNSAEEVERQRPRLRWVHDRKRVLTYAAESFALFLAAPFLIPGSPIWRQAVALPWYAVWIYTCLAGEAHRNLQPWCPWCRRGGDGDVPVDVVPPNPVGTKTNA